MYDEHRPNPGRDRPDSPRWPFRRRRRSSRRTPASRAARFARRLGMGVAAVSGVVSVVAPEYAVAINVFITALCGW